MVLINGLVFVVLKLLRNLVFVQKCLFVSESAQAEINVISNEVSETVNVLHIPKST